MLIDIVNQNDIVIDSMNKEKALGCGKNYRYICILVYNNHNELMICKLRDTQKNVEMWKSPVSGHVIAGESYTDAAKRLLLSELGVQGSPSIIEVRPVVEIDHLKFTGMSIWTLTNGFCPNMELYSKITFTPVKNILKYPITSTLNKVLCYI